MNIKEAIHVLRNPYGIKEEYQREAQLLAANELEKGLKENIMWKDYESKLITRTAHQISILDEVKYMQGDTAMLTTTTGEQVIFKYHEPISVGDFVVYLTDTDIYHCRREVFIERNIVDETNRD